MTTAIFEQYCIDYLVPAIRVHLPNLPEVKEVIMQMDRAGAHGGGRADINKILERLNRACQKETIPIRFIAQPSRRTSTHWILGFGALSRVGFRELKQGAEGQSIELLITCWSVGKRGMQKQNCGTFLRQRGEY